MHIYFCFQSNVADTSEDDISIKRHIEALKTESLKVAPNEDLIECKLRKTFNYRKALLYNPETTINDVLQDFPVLRQRNFVSVTY